MALALASIFFSAKPANATTYTYCFAQGCWGKDPATTGCSQDARLALSTSFSYTTVQLRYSPRCNAAWERIYKNTTYLTDPSGTIRNNLGQAAEIQSSWWEYNGSTSWYSDMVSDTTGQVAQACATEQVTNASGCTAYY